MSLQDEIDERASQIYRESYPMSIGELMNLYRDEELDIHPEFQRVFRWTQFQKTKLIESIMLNIPIPPIFVSQSADGVWDVIDGVQRLSTIFQFVGLCRDENGATLEPLVLDKTDYLPSFEGMMWENKANQDLSFTREQQLSFKRSRIDIIIMKKESDPIAKYELFQRLNTGGTKLSEQEVRNCLMIMTNKAFYEFVMHLSEIEVFQNCLPISDRRTDEQYRTELLLRMLIPNYINWDDISQYADFSQLLDKETLKICNQKLNYEQIERDFVDTFTLIYESFGEDAFKKYNGSKHLGSVMAAAFQSIATGVYVNIASILSQPNRKEWLQEKVHSFYSDDVFRKNTTPGVKAIPRFKELSEYGVEYFKP